MPPINLHKIRISKQQILQRTMKLKFRFAINFKLVLLLYKYPANDLIGFDKI